MKTVGWNGRFSWVMFCEGEKDEGWSNINIVLCWGGIPHSKSAPWVRCGQKRSSMRLVMVLCRLGHSGASPFVSSFLTLLLPF